MLGVIFEKFYGVKNLLKFIRIDNPIRSETQTKNINDAILPKEHQGKLKLFVLAGQSNMSGMGDLPKSGLTIDPRVYVFGNDYRWKLAQEPVDDPTHQVDLVSEDLSAGFGPSVAFATALLEQHPDIVIGLIPCAKGGSSIHEWRRDFNDNTLYGSCLKRIRAASVMGNIAGLLYFQGEIDAVDPKEDPQRTFSPHQWADKFIVLIKNWRHDLDLPELPVVFAQIGTNTEPQRFKNWSVVKTQQGKVRLPFSEMIVTDDLGLRDYVHFTTESYRIIGQRFAKTYLNLIHDKIQNKRKN
ncbi:MAG: sialate O-acetylesterase [Acaryochloridaceae cyanobacterium RU_4_10]|nr:sialate O-acetylesterase [Acaryochloridaceae cyanobacterium RU_4_10]